MEVEVSNQKDILLGNDYFQISYPNQNYKKSSEYKQWRKIVEKKFGKKWKEVFCEKDNIIIYQEEKNINNVIKCPKCKIIIYQCKYCNRIRNEITKNCCFKALLNDIKEKIKIDKNLNIEENSEGFYIIFFASFIPLFFSFVNALVFIGFFYLDLENKKGILIMDDIDEKKHLSVFLRFFLIVYLFSMTIAYSIFFYIIFIIILIISLPFKLYFIKLIISWQTKFLG